MGDKFHWADYLLYFMSISVGLVVGIVVAIKSRWAKQSSESFLIADKKLNWVMVGVSMFATASHGASLAVLPAEYYYNGNRISWYMVGFLISLVYAVLIPIPKYHCMEFNISAYEYFEKRYSVAVRIFVGIFNLFFRTFAASTMVFVPSVILAHVSHLNIYACIGVAAGVCAFYSVMGGMRAVVYVDNFQALLFLVGIVGVLIKSSVHVDGWSNAWEVYDKYGRNNAVTLDARPWTRHTIWNLVFLYGLAIGGEITVPQSMIQRFMAVKSMRHAQVSMVILISVSLVLQIMVFLTGVLTFGIFGGDDPYLKGDIEKRDQIFPYFLMKMVGSYPGVPGLMIAAMFAGALSTMSSTMTGLATTLLEDIIRPIRRRTKKGDLSPKATIVISKVAAVSAAALTVALSLVMPTLDEGLLTIFVSISSFYTGPMFGCFLASFFIPFVESIGIICGMVASTAWGMFLFWGSQSYGTGAGKQYLPLYRNNFTEIVETAPDSEPTPTFYDISYQWYIFLDVLVVLLVSSLVSCLVHCCRHKRWKYTRPSNEVLYTTKDFLVAIGVRKAPIKNQKSPEDDKEGEEAIKGQTEKVEGEKTEHFVNHAYDNTEAYDSRENDDTRL